MRYHKIIPLKDGRTCTLRNGTAEDGQALLDIFNLTHAQTDYLLTYPEESTHTAQEEAEFLKQKAPTRSSFLRKWTERSSARRGSAASAGGKRPGTARGSASAWTRRTGASGSGEL